MTSRSLRIGPGFGPKTLKANRGLVALHTTNPKLSTTASGGVGPQAQPLVHSGDITYLGALGLQPGFFGDSDFSFGGFGLTFWQDPVNGASLFMEGNGQVGGHIAQVKIPALVKSASWGALNKATVLQNFTDITKGTLPNISPTDDNSKHVYGMSIYNGKIIVGVNNYYTSNQDVSLGVLNTTTLAGGSFDGWYAFTGAKMISRLRNMGGHMATIPPEWQTLLGGKFFSGCGTGPLSVVDATSAGVGINSFDPDNIGSGKSNVGNTLIQFNSSVAIGPDHHTMSWSTGGGDTNTSSVWNLASWIGGFCFPVGTRTIIVPMMNGSGPYCYGLGGPTDECPDQYNPGDKGPHAPIPGYGYQFQMALFDANDLVDVYNGIQPAWNPQPYEIKLCPDGRAGNPGGTDSGIPVYATPKQPNGVAYDPVLRRIYCAMDYGTASRIECWQVAAL